MIKTILATCLLINIIAHSNTQEQNKISQHWIVSNKDLSTEIPDIIQSEENHEIEIVRQFNNEQESILLKKAEAIYPDKGQGDEEVWWSSSFDGVRIPYAITTAAVKYYLELSQAFQRGDFSGSSNIKMSRSRMKYGATS